MTKDKTEYIKNWLFRANEDIAVIKSLVKAGAEYYTSSICFHAQQASEKFLKAYLAYHDVDFPRTHDLDFLLIECQKIDKEAFQIDFRSLTDFGVSVRYPDDFYIPEEKEALQYCDTAIMVKEIVERLIKLTALPLTRGYKQKASRCSGQVITIFASHLNSFSMTTTLSPFTRFAKPALDSSSNRDSFIVRRDGKNCAMVSCQPGPFAPLRATG